MKYLLAILLFISNTALACQESLESKNARFEQYDSDANNFVTEDEWAKSASFGFDNFREKFDENHDNQLSKEEFLIISFTKGC